MARIVLTGTPTTLRRLRARDLPVDRDLSYSFWRWVNFSGQDLSAYNMTNMDIIDCQGDLSVLPGERRTDGLVSRRTSWGGVVLPADLSSLEQDLVSEALRQTFPSDNIIATVLAYLAGGYGRSFQDSIYNARQTLGFQNDPVGSNSTHIVTGLYARFPRLASRLVSHFQRSAVAATPPDITTDLNRLTFLADKDRLSVNVRAEVEGFSQYDRWAVARALELLLRQRLLDPDIKVHVALLHPAPTIYIAGGNYDAPAQGWWKPAAADSVMVIK